ncbi:nicotinamide riboside transporter PnuC [Mycolicibacterium sp. P9-64]|uniref:nicotinamide riboside transporter PnuC n=1 Tax=Mycolicibacterium sp. P9-64 TaxID=2024612 RepID=UPI001F5BE300|nr:nicotinamide riboside transporter PnuC [Mycolicibacterium sp. P9-64]
MALLDWLAHLVAPLNAVSFTLGNDQVSWAELFGFLTGGLCVALTVRRSIGNFPVGIANNVFFLVLFASAHLWASSGLQVLYIGLGIAGWWQWLHGAADRRSLPVRRARRNTLAFCALFVVIGTVPLYLLLQFAHDSAPFLDAVTTCLALAAQWLLNAKRIENWFFWIAADCIYVPMYLGQGLTLTAVVYVLFLVMCVAGLRSWTRELAQPLPIASPTVDTVR